MVTLAFAVIGGKEVGKSLFTRNALDQRKLAETPLTSSKVSLAGNLYRVQLFELAFDDIDFSGGTRMLWPKLIRGTAVPEFKGVFCLYDVTDATSITNVPAVLCMLPLLRRECLLTCLQPLFPGQTRRACWSHVIQMCPMHDGKCSLASMSRSNAPSPISWCRKPLSTRQRHRNDVCLTC